VLSHVYHTTSLITNGNAALHKNEQAQMRQICSTSRLSFVQQTREQNGGYLKSSVDNAWWAGISAA
jgi:hypothetical protein